MKDILKYKKVVIVVVVIVIAFVLYAYLFKNEKKNDITSFNPNSINANQPGAGKDIIVLLSDLKSIKLNDDIFSNPSFKKLVDFSLPISSEPKGRNNPFAPIGIDDMIFSASTTNSQ